MIGSIVLSLALACSITAMVMYFLNYRGYQNTLSFARYAYHGMAVCVISASAILLYFILNHDYSIKYIYSYSSNELPKGILAATFWAGQEGSFMLWLLFTSIVGIFLQNYSAKRGDLEPRIMAVYSLATTFLLIMVSPLFKNPFEFIWLEPIFINASDINSSFFNQPWLSSFMFSDNSTGQNFIKVDSQLYSTLTSAGFSIKDFIINGKGLNPQLLNFWMQIHPPILFAGFSMATVPFTFAIAALMKNDYKDWIRQSFPWVLAGSGILGLGIMLGGYWAYEMLGWGGYWAWDPVENSSLIPWLVGIASIHSMLVQKKSQAKGGIGKYARLNLILCILTYILVLYSTFLTRSGVLGDASVHSFVDPGMLVYLFLVIFIGSFILLGAGMLIYRWRYLNTQIIAEENLLSRDLALFTAAFALCASAFIVLLGTSAPLFHMSVETFFYNETHIPLAIIIGFLNGLSLLLKWKQTRGQELLKKSIASIALSVVLTALIVVMGGITDIMMILLAQSASFAFFVNAEIALKIIRGNLKMLGAYVAHIGIALFILGVIGSAAYSSQTDLELIKNQPNEAFGYRMVFTGYSPTDDNKYKFNINISKEGKDYSVSPVMYISDFNNGLMREPAILTMLTKDIYISPLSYEPEARSSKVISLQKGNTAEFNGVKLTFDNFNFPPEVREAMMAGKDFKIGADLIGEFNNQKKKIELTLTNTKGKRVYSSMSWEEADLKIELLKLEAGSIDLALSKLKTIPGQEEKSSEVLSVTASVKPFVNLVWTGVLVMVFGFFIAVARRLKESIAQ